VNEQVLKVSERKVMRKIKGPIKKSRWGLVNEN